MSVTCPRCQVENRDQAKRCLACNTDISRVRPAATPRPTSTRMCPSGRHPMDPGWKVCNYCKAEEQAKNPTPPPPPGLPAQPSAPSSFVPPSPAPPSPAPPSFPSGAPRRRQTAFMPSTDATSDPSPAPPPPVPTPMTPAPMTPPVASPPQVEPSGRRRTQFGAAPVAPSAVASPPPAPPAPVPTPPPVLPPHPVLTPAPVSPPSPVAASVSVPAPAPPPGRRIVGLLVTYTWHADGQVFPVREGRNYLGSDPEGDIALDNDPQLSGRHATILYRGRGFWIDDEKSMNGTFVGEECVEEKQKLVNYAEIRTGSTVWTFIVIEP